MGESIGQMCDVTRPAAVNSRHIHSAEIGVEVGTERHASGRHAPHRGGSILEARLTLWRQGPSEGSATDAITEGRTL